MARKTLTHDQVLKLKPRASAYPDPRMPGLYVRVHPSGRRVFCAVARDPNGKQKWVTIGDTTTHTIDAAREVAQEKIGAIKIGASLNGVETFEVVAEEWFKRHVEKNGLITAPDIRGYLNRVLIQQWGGREFVSIKRSDIATLMDDVEDNSGVTASDYVLSLISGICTWYAKRHDDYTSPIIRGMRRASPKERARDRILTDDELRAIWKTAAANGSFGAFIRVALLTGQRREKVITMRHQDIVKGEWTIPSVKRGKNTAGSLVLPKEALDIINAQPRFAGNPYVFAGGGSRYMSGVSKRKECFDRRAGVSGWTIHDLRRTAKSLMQRAGVRPDISERVLGHVIKGVEGVYDRHSYQEEKAHALNALAGLLATIINPPANNVRRFKRA